MSLVVQSATSARLTHLDTHSASGCMARPDSVSLSAHSKTALTRSEGPYLAEGVGFEPTVAVNHTRFRDGRIRPGYATPPKNRVAGATRLGEYSKLLGPVRVSQEARSAIRSGAETPIRSRPDPSTCLV